MTNYELFGPWTGNALHAPSTPYRIAHRRRAVKARIFIILCALSVIGGALYGWNH